MTSRFLFIACVGFLTGGAASGQDFEIECTLFRDNPAGKPTAIAYPPIMTKVGKEGTSFIGGNAQCRGLAVKVGREVRILPTVNCNGLMIHATLTQTEVVAPNNLPRVAEWQTTTSTVVQLGKAVKIVVEPDGDLEQWFEITLRPARPK